MPWQAHLWIGVPVGSPKDIQEAMKIIRPDVAQQISEEMNRDEIEDIIDQAKIILPITLRYQGRRRRKCLKPQIIFRIELEGGVDWPVPSGEAYTDAVVGFPITSRYSPTLLDADYPDGGRPEPFIVDIKACQEILNQIRKFWPEAQLLVWDEWH